MTFLTYIFAAFAVLGILDCIIGNKFKIGEEFEKGIMSLGPLALSMVGMICIAPAIAAIITPIVSPISSIIKFDPSVIIGSLLANDMGGAELAYRMSHSDDLGYFNGLIVGGTLGVTVSFTIPIIIKTVNKKYHKDVFLGILCGICTIPIGCIISGLTLGINLIVLILNMIPVVLVSIAVCFGLIVIPGITVRIFSVFGKIISVIIMLGLGIGIIDYLTGIEIISNMNRIEDAFMTVSGICIVLSGVFPMIYVISRILNKPLIYIGKLLGISADSVLCLISSTANSIPLFKKVPDLDRKGLIINMAFTVSSSFVFGDHLAFCAEYNAEFVPALIIGKLFSGLSAIGLALIIYKRTNKNGV